MAERIHQKSCAVYPAVVAVHTDLCTLLITSTGQLFKFARPVKLRLHRQLFLIALELFLIALVVVSYYLRLLLGYFRLHWKSFLIALQAFPIALAVISDGLKAVLSANAAISDCTVVDRINNF